MILPKSIKMEAVLEFAYPSNLSNGLRHSLSMATALAFATAMAKAILKACIL